MSRRYPRGVADQVEADQWLSQVDAAAALGVGIWRVGPLIANNHLVAAERPADDTMGVTQASVEVEREWRAAATARHRLVRLLRDALNWV